MRILLAALLLSSSKADCGEQALPGSTRNVFTLELSTAPAADPSQILSALRVEESPEARAKLIRVLHREEFRGPKTYQAFVDLMFSDTSDRARLAAAAGVLSYPSVETFKLIEKFLQEEQGAPVRKALCVELSTAAAYGEFFQAVFILARVASEDESLEVRRAAVQSLAPARDPRLVPALRNAVAAQTDAGLKRSLQAVIDKIQAVEVRRKKEESQPAKPPPGKEDFCGRTPGVGLCQCDRGGILKPKPPCVSREECQLLYENSYQRLGYTCVWDGQSLD